MAPAVMAGPAAGATTRPATYEPGAAVTNTDLAAAHPVQVVAGATDACTYYSALRCPPPRSIA